MLLSLTDAIIERSNLMFLISSVFALIEQMIFIALQEEILSNLTGQRF